MFDLQKIDDVLTMSSLDMVDFINSTRKEGDAELRHDSFMDKVPKVLGEAALKFSGTRMYGNNNTRKIYNLPKREACLMAMSYSYELMAFIIDRWEDGLSEIIESLNNFEVPDDIPDMYVYAIKEVDTGNIKLGISRNPLKRLKQLQTGNSSNLELVGYKKAVNGFKDEKALHNDNANKHIIGEWFSSDVVFS